MTHDEYDDYFCLDNCVNTYVCNDLSRFTAYKLLYNERIRFGNSDAHIEGTGKVTIHVDTLLGLGLIDLEDVAYVPNFYWNLVNIDSFEK